jgi:hypothetical protein
VTGAIKLKVSMSSQKDTMLVITESLLDITTLLPVANRKTKMTLIIKHPK